MPPIESLQNGGFSKNNEGLVVVPIDGTFSDGDASRWPPSPQCIPADPVTYLKKLATMWMKERGEYKQGHDYILDRLPDGYALLARARQKDPEIRDKYLYGHQSLQYFNSPNRFWPHFLYLMNQGKSPCKCENCTHFTDRVPIGNWTMPVRVDGRKLRGSKASAPGRPHKLHAGKPLGRPKAKQFPVVDEEGTPDIFKMLAAELKEKGKLDKPVKETMSMDWRAQRSELRDHFTRMFMQHSFIPRLGELVLWCPDLKGELRYNWDTESFQMYSQESETFLGVPQWRAGTVAQVPEENVLLQDIVGESKKEWAVNMSGFRIETFPDPNNTDKSLSSQYKYVPMNHVRPLNYWQIFLQGIPQEEYHVSIKYALTIMSSYSMLDRFRFKGTWPNASIYCRGIFLGAELLIRGDGVRLKPQKSSSSDKVKKEVTDVLVIEDIRMNLRSCDADFSSPLLCANTTVRLVGRAYTLSRERAYREPGSSAPKPLNYDEVVEAFEVVGMREYGDWYPLHSASSKLHVSLDQVIGRCYEPDAMGLMLGDISLGIDLEGVLAGREYGQKSDQRIAEGKEWFCGDSRVETLALETLNGEDVGKYDDARDMKMFRANLNIIDGTATAADIKDAKNPAATGRPREGLIGSKSTTTTFESVGKISTMVSSALGPPEPSTNATPMELTSGLASEAEGSGSVSASKSSSETETEETDEAAEFLRPLRYVRGGTEESSGGDYRPSYEPQAKRRKHE